MEDNLALNEKDILNKKFKKDVKGYDASEVDAFLDVVIKDYLSFKKIVANYDAKIASLKNDVHRLEIASNDKPNVAALKKRVHDLEVENASFRAKLDNIGNEGNVNKENYNYIVRLRELEKFIYQLGYDAKTLKPRK